MEHATTNYEARVPDWLRLHVEDLMKSWREEGRDDRRIEHLVKSLVLDAYTEDDCEWCGGSGLVDDHSRAVHDDTPKPCAHCVHGLRAVVKTLMAYIEAPEGDGPVRYSEALGLCREALR